MGIIPIATYLILPAYYNIAVSLAEVLVIAGVFLVRRRSKKTQVNWRITLAEIVAIVIIATFVSQLMVQFSLLN